MAKKKVENVVLIPCSGIGKSLGSVAREAAFEVSSSRPEVRIVCLASLTGGIEESLELVRANSVYTIDGCKKACAEKNVKLSNGKLQKAFSVLPYLKPTKLNPQGVIELDEAGKKLAAVIAKDIISAIDAQKEA